MLVQAAEEEGGLFYRGERFRIRLYYDWNVDGSFGDIVGDEATFNILKDIARVEMRPGVPANRYIIREDDKDGKNHWRVPHESRVVMKDLGTTTTQIFRKRKHQTIGGNGRRWILHREVLLVCTYCRRTWIFSKHIHRR